MLCFEDRTSCRGEFHVEVLRHGKVVDAFGDHNLVVNSGRVRLAELAAGKSDRYITQIGVGSGAEAEAEEDTSLENQHLFPLASTSVNGRDARFDFVIGENDANGLAIREFGLFCSDGAMFTHRVRRRAQTGEPRVIEKENDIELHGYWILHF